jgi:hypothetical protein
MRLNYKVAQTCTSCAPEVMQEQRVLLDVTGGREPLPHLGFFSRSV